MSYGKEETIFWYCMQTLDLSLLLALGIAAEARRGVGIEDLSP